MPLTAVGRSGRRSGMPGWDRAPWVGQQYSLLSRESEEETVTLARH
ncbi:hypothetical protein AB0C70_39995 [Streptomyces sp. NPDC048564]